MTTITKHTYDYVKQGSKWVYDGSHHDIVDRDYMDRFFSETWKDMNKAVNYKTKYEKSSTILGYIETKHTSIDKSQTKKRIVEFTITKD